MLASLSSIAGAAAGTGAAAGAGAAADAIVVPVPTLKTATDTTLEVQWVAVEGCDGYRVQYYVSGVQALFTSWLDVPLDSVNGTTCVIEALEPEVAYVVRVGTRRTDDSDDSVHYSDPSAVMTTLSKAAADTIRLQTRADAAEATAAQLSETVKSTQERTTELQAKFESEFRKVGQLEGQLRDAKAAKAAADANAEALKASADAKFAELQARMEEAEAAVREAEAKAADAVAARHNTDTAQLQAANTKLQAEKKQLEERCRLLAAQCGSERAGMPAPSSRRASMADDDSADTGTSDAVTGTPSSPNVPSAGAGAGASASASASAGASASASAGADAVASAGAAGKLTTSTSTAVPIPLLYGTIVALLLAIAVMLLSSK